LDEYFFSISSFGNDPSFYLISAFFSLSSPFASAL